MLKYSMMSESRNQATLNIMSKKNSLLEELTQDTLVKIKKFASSNNPDYQKLVRNLILESMIKMLETTLIIRVKQEDSQFVQKFFPELEREYSEVLKRETDRDYHCRLQIDNQFLDSEW